jgi:hypothetical protein
VWAIFENFRGDRKKYFQKCAKTHMSQPGLVLYNFYKFKSGPTDHGRRRNLGLKLCE